jgi:hypothetical protein
MLRGRSWAAGTDIKDVAAYNVVSPCLRGRSRFEVDRVCCGDRHVPSTG